MSADNEIGVLICLDQCRVAECRTSYLWGLDPDMPEPLAFQRQVMRDAWSGDDVKSFPTEQAALDEASQQYDEADYVEYGIHVYRTDLAWSELWSPPVEPSPPASKP
jgi:hypothetical protein